MPSTTRTERRRANVIGSPIDAVDWPSALDRIARWAAARESRVVCICNAHSVVTARRDPDFARVIADADLATPDGAPLAWLMRLLGSTGQQRINGPDLMWRYCELAAQRGEAICLYGSTPRTLDALQHRLVQAFPGLRIAGAISPPFRPLTPQEDAAVVRSIIDSGASSLWVSLGCPKQELWMAEHRGRIPLVMVGVGAAFDYHAGIIRRAPQWMQNGGLEWLYRLASEPRRLWRRYLSTNSAFVWQAMLQLAWRRQSDHDSNRRHP